MGDKQTFDDSRGYWRLVEKKIEVIGSEYYLRFLKKKQSRKEELLRYVNKPTATEFQTLSPYDQITNGEEYFAALDWALKDETVKNIALSGPYGSGKSSVIETYLKRHPSIKALNISLATFKETNEEKSDETGNSDEKKKKEQLIEEGILKQLFYKVDYKTIPQSRYRKLRRIKKITIFRTIIILYLLMLGSVGFFAKERMEDIFSRIRDAGTLYGFSATVSYMIVLSIALILGVFLTYVVHWFMSTWKSMEINIADKATLSNKKEDDASIFNKNLDEIVYFFETTNFETVFIEDLDRFQSNEIFVKLRELNTILNDYEMIKRRIVFVYAIKDDMFLDTDRTKFFDFIIPIIPYINSTNSNELLTKKLKELNDTSEVRYNISDRFVTLVSPFISDMRVLTSICNEFVVYKKTLSINQNLVKLKDEKMLAMMIFKNTYPKDFSEIEAEAGIIKKAFENKEHFVNEQKSIIENEIEEIENKLKEADMELLEDISELKAALFYCLSEKKGTVKTIVTNGASYTFDELMEPDFDLNKLSKCSLTVHYFTYPNGNTGSCQISNLENQFLHNGLSYITRWNNLHNLSAETKDNMMRAIREKKEEMNRINALGIGKIISNYSPEKVLDDSLCDNKLLVFLLRNEFIDETYSSYINYFHPNSITAEEQDFILSVRNYSGVGDFDFLIENCKKVVERLWETEFRQCEVLNFSLMDYLIEKQRKSVKYNTLLLQLSNHSDESRNFVKQYIDRGINTEAFVCDLSKKNDGLWEDFLEDPTIEEKIKTQYLGLILKNALIENIVAMNDRNEEQNEIRSYLESRKNILSELLIVNSQKMNRIIEILQVKFYQIEIDNVPKQILDKIYNEGFFVINTEMLDAYVKYKDSTKVEALNQAHFSTMIDVADENVIDYLEDNFWEYFHRVIISIATNTREKVGVVVRMIKLLEFDSESCEKIIEKEEFKIRDVSAVFQELLGDGSMTDDIKIVVDYFYKKDKIIVNWTSINSYIEQIEFNGVILSFIKVHLHELLSAQDKNMVDDSLVKEMLVEEWDDKSYTEILNNFIIADFSEPMNLYSKKQIELMIECHYLCFTPEHYAEIKELFPDISREFLVLYKKDFLLHITECLLNVDDVTELLLDDRLSEEEKNKIVKAVDVTLIDSEIAKWIRNTSEVFPKEFVKASWKVLEEEDKYELLKNHISAFTADDLESMFLELGSVYQPLADRTRRHKVSLYENEVNDTIMHYLEKIGYLSKVYKEIEKRTNDITFTTEEIHKIAGNVRKKKSSQ